MCLYERGEMLLDVFTRDAAKGALTRDVASFEAAPATDASRLVSTTTIEVAAERAIAAKESTDEGRSCATVLCKEGHLARRVLVRTPQTIRTVNT